MKHIIKIHYAESTNGIFEWIVKNNIQDSSIIAITRESGVFRLIYLSE